MKKRIVFIALFLSTLLVTTAASASASMKEGFVRVDVVTEKSLSKYDAYHEFIEFSEKGYQKIVFLAAASVREFKFIKITRNDDGLPVKGEALYSLDELQPEKPFVVTWMEQGSLPHRGITFIDGNNEARCFFISLHGDDGSVVLSEYPVACQGVPEAYKPIVDALFLFEKGMRQEEYDSYEDMKKIGFTEPPYPHDSALGYALVDLNNDGVLELLLGTIEDLGNASPNSIFTLKDGQPVLLSSFWSRSRAIIVADGTIYGAGSGGAAYTYLSSFTLDKKTNTLVQLTDIQSGYSDSEETSYYFQVVNGGKQYISQKQFDDFDTLYNDPPDRMSLTIPIVLQR